MANTSLKVTNWSKALAYNFNLSTVYQSITETKYQGDARLGSTVRINTIGATVAGTYVPGSDFAVLPVTSSYQDLEIDQFRYVATSIDEVDLEQTNINTIQEITYDSGYQLALSEDSYIAGLYTTISTGSFLGNDSTPLIATGSNAFSCLTKAALHLDKNNVPRDGNRYAVVPPDFLTELVNDGKYSLPNSGMYVNGLGNEVTVAGFKLYSSNNVPNTDGAKYKVICGHKSAIASVSQIDKVEIVKLEKQFGYLVKGLLVFGAKVINPKACVVMTVDFA